MMNKLVRALSLIFTWINFISFITWGCLLDSVISWQPYAIMAFNFAWLMYRAKANGYMYELEEE